MSNSEQRFKDVATQDFGEDEEARYRAFELLDNEMQASDALEPAIADLEKSQVTRQWLRWSFYGLTLLIGLWIVISDGKQTIEDRSYIFIPGMGGSSMIGSGPSDQATWGTELSREEKIILYGDTRYSTRSQQMHGLWAMEPENPAYFIEYAMAYHEDTGILPADFLKQANEIDPDNGWYSLVLAGVTSKDTVQKKPRAKPASNPRGGRGKRMTPKARARENTAPVKKPLVEYEVIDEANFKEALAGLYRSASMPQYESHQLGLFKKRISLLPQGGDFVTRLKPIAYMAAMPSHVFRVFGLHRVVRAEASRCGQEKDAEGLKKLISAWEITGRRLNADTVTLIDALIARAWVEGSLETFAKAALECDMPEVAKRFTELDEDAKTRKELRNERSKETESFNILEKKGGMLQVMGMPMIDRQVDFPDEVGDVHLKPGRMVDHAFFGRMLSASAWLLMLIVAAGVYVYRFRYGRVVGKLSTRLMALAKPVDLLWIMAGGVLAPLAYYWLINRYSPWSVTHHALLFYVGIPALGQFLCMFVLMLVLPLMITRWRLGKRAGMLGFGVRGQSWAWLWVLLVIVALPCFGFMPEDVDQLTFVMWSALACVAICALWLLARAVMANFGKRDLALKRVLVSRLLVMPYALAAFIMAVLVSVYHQQEYHWVSQDTDFMPSAEEPGFSRYEYRVSQQVKKELAEVMGWED
ncbi:hypothetical protein NT6N_36760 [Oceaniferula spumae]|uniref:Uncharacterized protein n=1 Tax=Oceaniferula spumae TaxID=2979115 RepID=A0AAT9FRH9_9BACT